MSCHDGSNDNFVRIIFLEFFGTFHPIPCSFLGDKFDVGEGGFFSEGIGCALEDSRSYIDDLVFVKDECFSNCKTPTHLEGSSDHGVGGGRWS